MYIVYCVGPENFYLDCDDFDKIEQARVYVAGLDSMGIESIIVNSIGEKVI